MLLGEGLNAVEAKVGAFSGYKMFGGHSCENISYSQKPAQQFLRQVGVPDLQPMPQSNGNTMSYPGLSYTNHGQLLAYGNYQDIQVHSFMLGNQATLTIPGQRVNRLLGNAGVYINTDIISQEEYWNCIQNQQNTSQRLQAAQQHRNKSASVDSTTYTTRGDFLQNKAVGICHYQEIDLLVTYQNGPDGKAYAVPRNGQIDVNAPAILLLSTPALNFAYGAAYANFSDVNLKYVTGMYRNLFNAAQQQGRQYIAMPAMGLGVFGGDPNLYFSALMAAAKEFLTLNIIYHPAGNSALFKQYLNATGSPQNVVEATKDVMFIADELTKNGKPCALVNPSDSAVGFGLYDVGMFWKDGRGANYVGEEHIGSVTTGPLNSRMLNPDSYCKNIYTYSAKPVVQAAPPQQPSQMMQPQQPNMTQFNPTASTVVNQSGYSIGMTQSNPGWQLPQVGNPGVMALVSPSVSQWPIIHPAPQQPPMQSQMYQQQMQNINLMGSQGQFGYPAPMFSPPVVQPPAYNTYATQQPMSTIVNVTGQPNNNNVGWQSPQLGYSPAVPTAPVYVPPGYSQVGNGVPSFWQQPPSSNSVQMKKIWEFDQYKTLESYQNISFGQDIIKFQTDFKSLCEISDFPKFANKTLLDFVSQLNLRFLPVNIPTAIQLLKDEFQLLLDKIEGTYPGFKKAFNGHKDSLLRYVAFCDICSTRDRKCNSPVEASQVVADLKIKLKNYLESDVYKVKTFGFAMFNPFENFMSNMLDDIEKIEKGLSKKQEPQFKT